MRKIMRKRWLDIFLCFTKSHVWWRHHDVMHYNIVCSNTIDLPTLIQKEFWNSHAPLLRYGLEFQEIKNSHKCLRWRHHDVISIFLYNTSRSTYIPSLNPIGLKVLEIWNFKICTFKMTSCDPWWRHHDIILQHTSLVVGLCTSYIVHPMYKCCSLGL